MTTPPRVFTDRMIERHSDPLYVSIVSRVPETGPSGRLGRTKPGHLIRSNVNSPHALHFREAS
ncbi:hypothetical protein NSND_61664 [Nitrospira sp. ND1]|nr:hypothetical protein NSND_61664 [Nitrospira sp. ND1]